MPSTIKKSFSQNIEPQKHEGAKGYKEEKKVVPFWQNNFVLLFVFVAHNHH